MRHGRSLAIFATVLFMAVLAAPATAQDPLVPPEVLAPADGATFPAGSTVTFQVHTFPDDDYLWVLFSRSPDPVTACGTIGQEVGLVGLDPTAPGSAIYEGTPTHFENYDFWLNRPGTYYWQAYRIHYGDGADGCIEAPVRSLTITGKRQIEIGPQPLDPGDGQTLPTGPVTFRASGMTTDTSLWIHVSRSPQAVERGVIGLDTDIERLQPTANPGVFSVVPDYVSGPTFWMNQPGVYYWQPYRISYFGDPDGYVEGPVRPFTLTSVPTPGPTPTPMPMPVEPVTVRGDEAFVKGTANDLYLACTKLDLYLIDVLPAGRKVAVTGAADLRLHGQTVSILLDGKRVGRAVVRSSGAFAATVRAPTQARRTRARYRAVLGSARSQNLKLVRRMVTAKLARSGGRLKLTGRLTKPFAKRPATIGIQRYIACGRVQALTVKAVRPTSAGRFTVTFPVPQASVRALMYRAKTKVASRPGGAATRSTYTLPRALDIG